MKTIYYRWSITHGEWLVIVNNEIDSHWDTPEEAKNRIWFLKNF